MRYIQEILATKLCTHFISSSTSSRSFSSLRLFTPSFSAAYASLLQYSPQEEDIDEQELSNYLKTVSLPFTRFISALF